MADGIILSPTKVQSFQVDSKRLHIADFVEFEADQQIVVGQVVNLVRSTERTLADINVLGSLLDGKLKMPTVPPVPGSAVYTASDKIIKDVLHSTENGIYVGILRGHHVKVSLNPDVLLKKHLSIISSTGGGKSYSAGIIIEELLKRRYPVVVIDVADEYREMIYPNHMMEKWQRFKRYPRGYPENFQSVNYWDKTCKKLIKAGTMTTVNLKKVKEGDRPSIVQDVCDNMFEWIVNRKIKPCFLIIEETHNFAPQAGSTCASDSIIKVVSEGRKHGLGCCVITQRPAKLDKNVLSQCWTAIIHKLMIMNDLKAVTDNMENAPPNSDEIIQQLSPGEGFVVGGGLSFPVVIETRERMSGYMISGEPDAHH